jgi:hypothetical protein
VFPLRVRWNQLSNNDEPWCLPGVSQMAPDRQSRQLVPLSKRSLGHTQSDSCVLEFRRVMYPGRQGMQALSCPAGRRTIIRPPLSSCKDTTTHGPCLTEEFAEKVPKKQSTQVEVSESKPLPGGHSQTPLVLPTRWSAGQRPIGQHPRIRSSSLSILYLKIIQIYAYPSGAKLSLHLQLPFVDVECDPHPRLVHLVHTELFMAKPVAQLWHRSPV